MTAAEQGQPRGKPGAGPGLYHRRTGLRPYSAAATVLPMIIACADSGLCQVRPGEAAAPQTFGAARPDPGPPGGAALALAQSHRKDHHHTGQEEPDRALRPDSRYCGRGLCTMNGYQQELKGIHYIDALAGEYPDCEAGY